MLKSIRDNRRVSITQDLQNLYPYESRARSYKYSVAAQIFNPLALELLNNQLDMERVLNNYVPPIFDTEDIDVVYRIPNVFGTSTSTPKFYEGTSTTYTEVTKTTSDLDSFWYSRLPTRLEPVSTNTRTLYTEKLNGLYAGHTSTAFSLRSNYIGTNTSEITASDVQTSFTNQILNIYCTSGTVATVRFQSTQTASDPALMFEWYDTITNTAIARKEVFYGLVGAGTATATNTSPNHLTNYRNYYFYDGFAQTGVPFCEVKYYMTATSTNDLDLRDWFIKDFVALQDLTTSPYLNRTFKTEHPNYAFVTVRNGSSLSMSDINQPQVSGVLVHGVNHLGQQDRELISTPYNGVHQSLKRWLQLDKVLPYHMPNETYYDVELQHFQKTYPTLDTVQSFVSPDEKSFLFKNVSTDSGTAFLEFQRLFSGGVAFQSTEGSVLVKKIQLADTNGSAIQAVDAAYDMGNQLMYVLDTASKVHLFDTLDHWPSQTAITASLIRTHDPIHKIEFLGLDDDSPTINETKHVTHYWADRSYFLLKHRWILQKPNGTVVGIDEDFNEVAHTTDFWITNEESYELNQGVWRFNGVKVPILFDQYGDYILVLESEFREDDSFVTFRENDVVIFSVFKKEALKTYTPDLSLGTPIGIDFYPNRDLVLAYANSDNPYSIFEQQLRLRYDYYYVSDDNRELVFRENYGHIYLILQIDGDDEVCVRTILVKTSNDALTEAQTDCYFVVCNSAGGAMTFALPEITSGMDGYTVTIKRYGANLVTVNRGGSDTIDGATSLAFITNLDAYTLTAVYSLNMWMIS